MSRWETAPWRYGGAPGDSHGGRGANVCLPPSLVLSSRGLDLYFMLLYTYFSSRKTNILAKKAITAAASTSHQALLVRLLCAEFFFNHRTICISPQDKGKNKSMFGRIYRVFGYVWFFFYISLQRESLTWSLKDLKFLGFFLSVHALFYFLRRKIPVHSNLFCIPSLLLWCCEHSLLSFFLPHPLVRFVVSKWGR